MGGAVPDVLQELLELPVALEADPVAELELLVALFEDVPVPEFALRIRPFELDGALEGAVVADVAEDVGPACRGRLAGVAGVTGVAEFWVSGVVDDVGGKPFGDRVEGDDGDGADVCTEFVEGAVALDCPDEPGGAAPTDAPGAPAAVCPCASAPTNANVAATAASINLLMMLSL